MAAQKRKTKCIDCYVPSTQGICNISLSLIETMNLFIFSTIYDPNQLKTGLKKKRVQWLVALLSILSWIFFNFFSRQASVNPLQGILNCLVYGQHRQFASFCNHILSLRHSTSPPNNDDLQERNRTLTINSFSGSVKIPVSEISPLLSGSRRNTPVLSQSPSHGPREVPFAAKLLGEFSR